MLLKMEEIKLQLRLDDDFSDEDELLELLGKAAQSRTENFLNRKLYATADDRPADDPDGLVISSARVRTVLPVVTPRLARLPPIWMMTTLTCCRKNFVALLRHPVPVLRRRGTTSCLPRFVRCC